MAKKASRVSSAVATAEAPGKPAQGVNKAKAIAEAFKTLGRDASGQDVIGYVRQKFGINVSANYVSILRGEMKKKRGGRPKQGQALNGQEGRTPVASKPPAASAHDLIALIREVKALAQRAGGMGELKRLVDALAE
jgi:hypothetical protein